jgi:hypothetical protein
MFRATAYVIWGEEEYNFFTPAFSSEEEAREDFLSATEGAQEVFGYRIEVVPEETKC